VDDVRDGLKEKQHMSVHVAPILYSQTRKSFTEPQQGTLHLNINVFYSCLCTYYLSIALQSFVGPWPLFQFLNPIYSRQVSLDGKSARRKASTYTQNNTNRINAYRHPCFEWDSSPRSQRSSGRRRFMP
jgi:hypothetical protein